MWITGQINFDGEPVSPDILKKMMTFTHRGPDGEGHWIEENIGLGHRRLAIIDNEFCWASTNDFSDNRFVLTYK